MVQRSVNSPLNFVHDNSTPQVSHFVIQIFTPSHFISPIKNKKDPILTIRGRTYCQPYHSSQTKTLLESVYSQGGPRWRRVDPGGAGWTPLAQGGPRWRALFSGFVIVLGRSHVMTCIGWVFLSRLLPSSVL